MIEHSGEPVTVGSTENSIENTTKKKAKLVKRKAAKKAKG